MNIAKFLRTASITEHLWWPLLYFWTITMLSCNLVLGNLRTMNNLKVINILNIINGMLYEKRQLLMLSQSRFKQLLSASLTDKYQYYLCQFVSAFLFPRFLLIEGYAKCALQKEPVTGCIFIKHIFRKSYWQTPLTLRAL